MIRLLQRSRLLLKIIQDISFIHDSQSKLNQTSTSKTIALHNQFTHNVKVPSSESPNHSALNYVSNSASLSFGIAYC